MHDTNKRVFSCHQCQVEQRYGTDQPTAVLQLPCRHVFDCTHPHQLGQLHALQRWVLFVGEGCHRQQHVQALSSRHVFNCKRHHHCGPVHQVRPWHVLRGPRAVRPTGMHPVPERHVLAGSGRKHQHDVHPLRHGQVVRRSRGHRLQAVRGWHVFDETRAGIQRDVRAVPSRSVCTRPCMIFQGIVTQTTI